MQEKVGRTLSLAFLLFTGQALFAQISSFQHVVIVVQENRTPDNLFQGLCVTPVTCSTTPTKTQYDIQTKDWLDKTAINGVTQPLSVALNATYDLPHIHSAFTRQCDLNSKTGVCRMDGFATTVCSGCPSQPQLRYVDNSTGVLDPYLLLATHYGWANYMFQTNQGPSFPAHQFLFGATSAPTATDDAAGIYASENAILGGSTNGGCTAGSGATVKLISPPNNENHVMYPCFEHNTIPDLLPSTVTWRYYAPNPGSIWTAPNAISHICQPSLAAGGACLGPLWINNVDLKSADVLSDIGKCKLRNLSWVIPTGANSDHPVQNKGGGPSWVASIVNAVGQSACKNPDGSSYWDTTAILITWDDWGGWYDHEPPTILPQPQGDYQYGFRVPFLFVSAYTPAGYVDNGRHDFGSIVRFVEHNFGVQEGTLTFSDARAQDNLSTFFDLNMRPRAFVPIPTRLSAAYFINDRTPATDPDND
jgi:phospholipase C